MVFLSLSAKTENSNLSACLSPMKMQEMDLVEAKGITIHQCITKRKCHSQKRTTFPIDEECQCATNQSNCPFWFCIFVFFFFFFLWSASLSAFHFLLYMCVCIYLIGSCEPIKKILSSDCISLRKTEIAYSP